jgi:hypothetical protein
MPSCWSLVLMLVLMGTGPGKKEKSETRGRIVQDAHSGPFPTGKSAWKTGGAAHSG